MAGKQNSRRYHGRIALYLALWTISVGPVAASADEIYFVKRGDTLFSIARSHGIAPMTLAERNDLSRNFHVFVGERLVIPVKTHFQPEARPAVPAPVPTGPALPAAVQRILDEADVQPGRWRYIVIHHSGVDTGTVRAMDRYHREVRHMENGLAYHFVIGNGSGMGDGEIAVGRRWTAQLDGGHLASEAQNRIALGICLVGDFDERKPSPRQLQSLVTLIRALLQRCQLTPGAVELHRQINVVGTRCPGRFFPAKNFLDGLKRQDR